MRNRIVFICVLCFYLFLGCSACGGPDAARPQGGFVLTSPAFKTGAPIPSVYTCDGSNGSPELRWTGTPAGTKSFALLCEDVSGPQRIFVHWVVWNIPSTVDHLPGKMPRTAKLADGTEQGKNDMPMWGYDGPCPPVELKNAREYVFTLFALDLRFETGKSYSAGLLLMEMEGHVLGRAKLRGTYRR